MTFAITSARWGKFEELVEHYPYLLNFGFKVVENTYHTRAKTRVFDECGKLIDQWRDVERTTRVPYIVINSLDELLDLKEAVHESLIIGDTDIEIYDGYRE